MKVLTVDAHPDPKSFCHAVLEEFTAGLCDAGHSVRLPAGRLSADRLRVSIKRAMHLTAGAQRIAAAFKSAGGPAAAADGLEQLTGTTAIAAPR